MKNLLLRKGAMVLAVAIALSSAVLGTNVFADISKNEETDINKKTESETYKKIVTEEELENIFDLQGVETNKGESISSELISAFSINDLYDSYVENGVLTQKEANKLKEVEKQVEKLYNELDLGVYNGNIDKINVALEEASKKEKELRKTVEEILKKTGIEIVNNTKEVKAIQLELDGSDLEVGDDKYVDGKLSIKSTNENTTKSVIGIYQK